MNESPSISLRQIQCFLEVCRDFHFSNAAKRLGLTQPPLSRSIQDLESAIGSKLLDRNPKKVSLTSAGHAFLDEIYQLPMLINRAVDAANRADKGETSVLRVGFFGALLGDELLATYQRFRNRYPDIQLKLMDASPASLIEQISDGQIDIGFLGLKPQNLPSNLAHQTWRTDRLTACLPLSHKLTSHKNLTPQKLSLEKIVALTADTAPTYRQLIDHLFSETPRKPAIVHQTESVSTLISLVVAGEGIALLPVSTIAAVRNHLTAIPIKSSKAKIGNTLVYRKDNSKTELAFFRQTMVNA